MENQTIITAYLIYLPIAIALTLYVAKILFKNGKVFMLDIFRGRTEIAFATNRLFEVGFYLLNIGFALLILKIGGSLFGTQQVIEVLSLKLGGFSIYLGFMLMLNLYFFFRGKRKVKEMLQRETYMELKSQGKLRADPNQGQV